MKSEEARKIADDALARLSEGLKAGRSEQLLAYLTAMAKFHRYSIHNLILIVCQRPDATHVAGFHTWKQLGRFVRKGEKGILILAPMLLRKSEDDVDPGDTQEKRRVLRFRAVYVFDVSQTDGKPLPDTVRFAGDPSGHLDRLRRTIAGAGITVDYGGVPPGADGVSTGGRIGLRPGMAPAEEFAVLVHEYAHECLHRGDDRPKSKKVRETEAEAVAFVVSTAIGLEAKTASSDYISLYDGDDDVLAASLDRIQRTAAEMMVAILGEPERTPERESADTLMSAGADCRSNSR
ncbi:MAG: ArdC family protein [Phycisphaerales bacterium]